VIATNLTGRSTSAAPSFRDGGPDDWANRQRLFHPRLHGDANLSAHCAAKFGLIGFTQSLAKEMRASNVTVTPSAAGRRTTGSRRGASPRKAPLARNSARATSLRRALARLRRSGRITGSAIESTADARDDPAVGLRSVRSGPAQRASRQVSSTLGRSSLSLGISEHQPAPTRGSPTLTRTFAREC